MSGPNKVIPSPYPDQNPSWNNASLFTKQVVATMVFVALTTSSQPAQARREELLPATEPKSWAKEKNCTNTPSSSGCGNNDDGIKKVFSLRAIDDKTLLKDIKDVLDTPENWSPIRPEEVTALPAYREDVITKEVGLMFERIWHIQKTQILNPDQVVTIESRGGNPFVPVVHMEKDIGKMGIASRSYIDSTQHAFLADFGYRITENGRIHVIAGQLSQAYGGNMWGNLQGWIPAPRMSEDRGAIIFQLPNNALGKNIFADMELQISTNTSKSIDLGKWTTQYGTIKTEYHKYFSWERDDTAKLSLRTRGPHNELYLDFGATKITNYDVNQDVLDKKIHPTFDIHYKGPLYGGSFDTGIGTSGDMWLARFNYTTDPMGPLRVVFRLTAQAVSGGGMNGRDTNSDIGGYLGGSIPLGGVSAKSDSAKHALFTDTSGASSGGTLQQFDVPLHGQVRMDTSRSSMPNIIVPVKPTDPIKTPATEIKPTDFTKTDSPKTDVPTTEGKPAPAVEPVDQATKVDPTAPGGAETKPSVDTAVEPVDPAVTQQTEPVTKPAEITLGDAPSSLSGGATPNPDTAVQSGTGTNAPTTTPPADQTQQATTGSTGTTTVTGGTAPDTTHGGSGSDTVWGGIGIDTAAAAALAAQQAAQQAATEKAAADAAAQQAATEKAAADATLAAQQAAEALAAQQAADAAAQKAAADATLAAQQAAGAPTGTTTAPTNPDTTTTTTTPGGTGTSTVTGGTGSDTVWGGTGIDTAAAEALAAQQAADAKAAAEALAAQQAAEKAAAEKVAADALAAQQAADAAAQQVAADAALAAQQAAEKAAADAAAQQAADAAAQQAATNTGTTNTSPFLAWDTWEADWAYFMRQDLSGYIVSQTPIDNPIFQVVSVSDGSAKIKWTTIQVTRTNTEELTWPVIVRISIKDPESGNMSTPAEFQVNNLQTRF